MFGSFVRALVVKRYQVYSLAGADAVYRIRSGCATLVGGLLDVPAGDFDCGVGAG